MLALALTTVLIVQTWGGDVYVHEGLSDHACEEARCVAESNMSCSEEKASQVAATFRAAQEDARWVDAHPKEVAACRAKLKVGKSWGLDCTSRVGVEMTTKGYFMVFGEGRINQPGDPKTLRCVK